MNTVTTAKIAAALAKVALLPATAPAVFATLEAKEDAVDAAYTLRLEVDTAHKAASRSLRSLSAAFAPNADKVTAASEVCNQLTRAAIKCVHYTQALQAVAVATETQADAQPLPAAKEPDTMTFTPAPRTVKQTAGNNPVLARIKKAMNMPTYMMALGIANTLPTIEAGNIAAVQMVCLSSYNPPARFMGMQSLLHDIKPVEADGTDAYYEALNDYLVRTNFGAINYPLISTPLQKVVRDAMRLRYGCVSVYGRCIILLGYDLSHQQVKVLIEEDGPGTLKATQLTGAIPENTPAEQIYLAASVPTGASSFATLTGNVLAEQCSDLIELLWEAQVNAAPGLFANASQYIGEHSL